MRGDLARCAIGVLAAIGAAVGGVEVGGAAATPGEAAAAPANERITIDAPVASAYQAVHIRITGLTPGYRVTITSSAHDYTGKRWQAQATFTADSSGTVDLAKQAPTSGSYTGADAMGLVWSMSPSVATGGSASFFFVPAHPEIQPGFPIDLAVRDEAGHVTHATLTRLWMTPGVTHRTLTPSVDGVYGDLYLPPRAAGTARRPAVLLFGGSEGGESERYTAAVLASEGYPALSLAYFGEPGLPGTLTNIPLDYFAAAARLLAGQPGVDPRHVLALGASRGAEAALLLAQNFPGLVHGAILYGPTTRVNPSFPDGVSIAWTLHGVALAAGMPIPVDQISGPILAIAGADDAVWNSPESAAQIVMELDTDRNPYPHKALIYPDAGHGIDAGVDVPSSTSYTYPASGYTLEFGGTRKADAAAQQAAWQRVLALLASLRQP